MKNFCTIPELLSFQNENFENESFLNFTQNSKKVSFSNKEFTDNSFYFACGLKELGLKRGERVANYSYQNPIWIIVDFGIILASGVSVPIFSNISKSHLVYELKHSDTKYIFSDNSDIKNIIQEEGLDIVILDFDEVIAIGKKTSKNYDFKKFIKDVSEDDLATIIYTSGSTGDPKGVELTHKNLISQVKGTKKAFPLNHNSDVALSFLPLAHIFERMVMMFYISQGITIHFVDDVDNLGIYLKEVRPTVMTTVPRMLEKVFTKISVGIDSAPILKRFLGSVALKKALLKDVNKKQDIFDKIFDALIYKKFRQALGSKMQKLICGGAALSNDLERFYRNIGINLFCGYGLTESSPVLSVNYEGNYKFGSVGKKFSLVELKIADDGEILARGPNIMKGYHNNLEATNEAIKDGWLYSGDLGEIDENGFLTITGRKKELLKTSTGKYVCPVPIEQRIMQELGFSIGVLLIAEGRKFVSALIFPDFELVKKLQVKLKYEKEDFFESKELQNYIQKRIDKINNNLDSWQQIKKFVVLKQEISIETGEITPSMKLKRSFIEKKFHETIDKIY